MLSRVGAADGWRLYGGGRGDREPVPQRPALARRGRELRAEGVEVEPVLAHVGRALAHGEGARVGGRRAGGGEARVLDICAVPKNGALNHFKRLFSGLIKPCDGSSASVYGEDAAYAEAACARPAGGAALRRALHRRQARADRGRSRRRRASVVLELKQTDYAYSKQKSRAFTNELELIEVN